MCTWCSVQFTWIVHILFGCLLCKVYNNGYGIHVPVKYTHCALHMNGYGVQCTWKIWWIVYMKRYGVQCTWMNLAYSVHEKIWCTLYSVHEKIWWTVYMKRYGVQCTWKDMVYSVHEKIWCTVYMNITVRVDYLNPCKQAHIFSPIHVPPFLHADLWHKPYNK